jgi:hypothetical protein
MSVLTISILLTTFVHAQFSLFLAFWFASLRAQQTIESVFALTFGVVSIEPLVVHAC